MSHQSIRLGVSASLLLISLSQANAFQIQLRDGTISYVGNATLSQQIDAGRINIFGDSLGPQTSSNQYGPLTLPFGSTNDWKTSVTKDQKLTASLSTDPHCDCRPTAITVLQYQFAIVPKSDLGGGIVDPTEVKVKVKASGDVDKTNFSNSATANLTVYSKEDKYFGNTNIIAKLISTDRSPYTSDSEFNISDFYTFTTGITYNVFMSANAATGYQYNFEQLPDPSKRLTAESYIDPVFSIDPSVSDQYALVFSDGIEGSLVSAVPLPASAPLFGAALLGLAGLGYAAKRKKATAAV